MNTRISYLYRDASNYKMPNEVVVTGTVTECQIDIIMGCLDEGEYFIPRMIGLPEKRFDEFTEDDHCWFELQREGFEVTMGEPNVDVTADELVRKFFAAKGNWKKGELDWAW